MNIEQTREKFICIIQFKLHDNIRMNARLDAIQWSGERNKKKKTQQKRIESDSEDVYTYMQQDEQITFITYYC